MKSQRPQKKGGTIPALRPTREVRVVRFCASLGRSFEMEMS